MALKAREKLMLFSGSSNPELASRIAARLGTKLAKVELSRFSDGEVYVRCLESIRGANVFVFQSICQPVNANLVELLVMLDALKRASAYKVSAVIPYYGYSRQDKKTAAREPITAKLIADLLTTAGIDRMVSMDLHAGQIQGFFNVPVDHLTALPLLVRYFKKKHLKDLVVVSPDVGRVKIAKKCADRLKGELAILHKTRPTHNVAEVAQVIGDVKGKTALLIDDMIDTAGTLVGGAEALVKAGASKVYACATHAILSPPAVDRLMTSSIEEVVVSNTVVVGEDKQFFKLKTVDVSELFAKAVGNIYRDGSVSSLFQGEDNI